MKKLLLFLTFICVSQKYLPIAAVQGQQVESQIRLENLNDIQLLQAAETNNLEMVNVFITAGADLNVQNNTGYTPLLWATHHNNLEMVNALITANADPDNADPDIANSRGSTPLLLAAHQKNLALIDIFLRQGQGESTRRSLLKARLYIKWINYIKPVVQIVGPTLTFGVASYLLYKIITTRKLPVSTD